MGAYLTAKKSDERRLVADREARDEERNHQKEQERIKAGRDAITRLIAAGYQCNRIAVEHSVRPSDEGKLLFLESVYEAQVQLNHIKLHCSGNIVIAAGETVETILPLLRTKANQDADDPSPVFYKSARKLIAVARDNPEL